LKSRTKQSKEFRSINFNIFHYYSIISTCVYRNAILEYSTTVWNQQMFCTRAAGAISVQI